MSPATVRAGIIRLCRSDEVEEQPLPMPLLGHQRDALRAPPAAASARRAAVPATSIVPACGPVQAEDRLEQLRASGSDQAEQADDLAGRDLSETSRKHGAGSESADLERRRCRRPTARMLGPRRQIAPDHRPHDADPA